MINSKIWRAVGSNSSRSGSCICPNIVTDIEEEEEASNATVNITNQTEIADIVVEEEA